jgi:hypothetical protein
MFAVVRNIRKNKPIALDLIAPFRP